jgi:hypothetical protein
MLSNALRITVGQTLMRMRCRAAMRALGTQQLFLLPLEQII